MMGNCDSTVILFIYQPNRPCLFAYNQQATEYGNAIKVIINLLHKKTKNLFRMLR